VHRSGDLPGSFHTIHRKGLFASFLPTPFNALLTGPAHGIGFVPAERLTPAGAEVILLGESREPAISKSKVIAERCQSALYHIASMRRYFLVASGGGFGSLMRFAIAQWVSSMPVWTPLAILIINVSGCFAISFLNFVSDPTGDIYLGPRSRLFLLVGVCGGYTTFSSFSLISFNAARQGVLADLWLNIGLSQLLCLFGVWVGAIVAKPFPRVVGGVLKALRT
jgi:fluoride exporter